MNSIQIPTKVQKSVKSNNKPMCQIINDTVIIRLGFYKNGNEKITTAKIIQLSESGIYCDNDEFYPWKNFK